MKIKNIDKIVFGYYEIETWYYSPYPSEFTVNRILYICEFCLKYIRKKSTFANHKVSNCFYFRNFALSNVRPAAKFTATNSQNPAQTYKAAVTITVRKLW